MASYFQTQQDQSQRDYPNRNQYRVEEMRQHRPTDSYASSEPATIEQHITTVAHVGFTDALIAQKPSPWTKTMFKLYFFLLVAFLNSCINGYDGSVMSGINAMDQYHKWEFLARVLHFSDIRLTRNYLC